MCDWERVEAMLAGNEPMTDGYKFTFTSDQLTRGGQHTNGPDFGVWRCEHMLTRTAVEAHTSWTKHSHEVRELTRMLCEMAVKEITHD